MNIFITTEEKQELYQILSDLVKIKSINPPGKEKKVSEYLMRLFDSENIKYEISKVTSNRMNLIVKFSGKSSEYSTIFTGHQDVVPVSKDEIKRWNFDPFSGEIKNGFLLGRGSSDMKSGLASFIYALILLNRKKLLPKHDIILLITCDEEHYMSGSSKALSHPDIKKAKYAVVCEPTSLQIHHQSRGRTWAKVEIFGKTAHGSQKNVGLNAIEIASQIIVDIKNFSFNNTSSFWQTYKIEAGVEPAIVPDYCAFYVDARLGLNHNPDEVWIDLKNIIEKQQKENPLMHYKIEVIEKRDPWHTDINNYLIQNCASILQTLGINIQYSCFPGSTDGSKLNNIGIETLIIGPGNLSMAHRENEQVLLNEVSISCNLYLNMMIEI